MKTKENSAAIENQVVTNNLNQENNMETKSKDQLEIKMEKEFKKAQKQVAKSIVMKVQIMERTESGYTINEDYRKFGLIKENRPIKKADVTGFMQVIRNGKYDESQSIVAIEAKELAGRYEIVDLEGNPINKKDINDYLIVLDGQHRISAFSKLNAIRDTNDMFTIPNVHIKKDLENIGEYLADINMVGHSWNTADKVCVSAISTGNEIMKKINSLIKDGFNASAAVMICTGKKLTPTQLKVMLSKGDTSILPDTESALKRAEMFLTTALSIEEMNPKVLTKRYFIKGFH